MCVIVSTPRTYHNSHSTLNTIIVSVNHNNNATRQQLLHWQMVACELKSIDCSVEHVRRDEMLKRHVNWYADRRYNLIIWLHAVANVGVNEKEKKRKTLPVRHREFIQSKIYYCIDRILKLLSRAFFRHRFCMFVATSNTSMGKIQLRSYLQFCVWIYRLCCTRLDT